jgi:hypothetical protein
MASRDYYEDANNILSKLPQGKYSTRKLITLTKRSENWVKRNMGRYDIKMEKSYENGHISNIYYWTGIEKKENQE